MRQLPARDPGVPDSRSVNRFLLWVWREQWRSQALGVFWGMAWMVSIAMMPAMIGRAIDHGLLARSTSGLLTWTGVVLGLSVFAAVAGAMRHRSAMTNWLAAAYVTVQVTARHAVKVGADLPKLIASGDVLAIGTTDIEAVGGTFDILARLTGAIVSTIVVAIIMLTTSVPLGLVVLIGVPVTLVCTVFLMRPLHHRQDTYRELQGKLSDQTVDIAQGIRILRGIGGEDAFSARYAAGSQRLRGIGIRVGRVESLLSAEEVLLPGLLTGLVTWLAAHFALHGEITVGQLVAFYGYASFLVMPLATFGEAANSVTRGHVAAGHVIRLLRINSPITEPESPATPPPTGVPLADADSGLTITPGELLAIACADPEDAEHLANRLARYVDDGIPMLGGVPLKDLPVRVLRERILAAGNADRVFTGTLRSSLTGTTTPPDDGRIDAVAMEESHGESAEHISPAGTTNPPDGGAVTPPDGGRIDAVVLEASHGASAENASVAVRTDPPDGGAVVVEALHSASAEGVSLTITTTPADGWGIDAVVMEALRAASAEDIVAALDGGLDAEVEEKGRNFSGGQLQRLRLARALIADPEFLIAVEATSAVDAHTEARIAARIGAYRASRSGPRATALFTTSPLVLDHADVVAYVEDGQVVATGRHGELLAAQPRYKALVTRGEDDSESAGFSSARDSSQGSAQHSSQQGVVRV